MKLNNSRRANRHMRFLLLAVAALLAGAQAADAKPDFSGDWKQRISKSEFGPILSMPAPTSRTDKIVHADPDLEDITPQSGPNGQGIIQFKYHDRRQGKY
jgi:hypothetical protein